MDCPFYSLFRSFQNKKSHKIIHEVVLEDIAHQISCIWHNFDDVSRIGVVGKDIP